MKKKVEKATCPCGKKFVKKAVNQKYCSIKCKRQAAKSAPSATKKSDKKCSGGKPFAKKPVAIKNTKKPVAKKITEKVTLPKPQMKKPDVIVIVHGNDPYKKFAIALQIAIREFGNILAATHYFEHKKSK